MSVKGNLKVVFAPYWRKNPYQSRLAEALASCGVTVCDDDDKGCLLFFRSHHVRRADVIHLHWLDSYFRSKTFVRSFAKAFMFVLGLLWARIRAKRIVWTVHNLANHDQQYPALERFLQYAIFHLAHGIICHSDEGLKRVEQAIGRSSARIHVIPHGHYIDSYPNRIGREEARHSLGYQDDDVLLLFLGLVRRYKGVLELAKAVTEVPGGRLKLLIAGQCDDEALVEQLTAYADSDPRIGLAWGYVPDEKVQVYQNAADCTAFPYLEFLTSGAVILAMSFGRCCLVPRAGFFDEFLDDQGAFFYDPGSAGSLRMSIERMLENYNECQLKGEYNYELARKLDWDMIAQRTYSIYT